MNYMNQELKIDADIRQAVYDEVQRECVAMQVSGITTGLTVGVLGKMIRDHCIQKQEARDLQHKLDTR